MMQRSPSVGGIILATIVLLAAPAWAGPGDPLGDGSCTHVGVRQRKCQERIVRALAIGYRATMRCHAKQAVAAATGAAFDDDACELAATLYLRQLPRACDPEVVRAAAHLDASLDTLLDGPVNTLLYCDATSATPIDPTGEETGFVPPSRQARRCIDKREKAAQRLVETILKCFRTAARADFHGKPFDSTACLANARDGFDGRTMPSTSSRCAACLETGGSTLGDAVASFLTAERASTFPCLTGYFFRQVDSLDESPSTAADATRATVRRVNRDEPAVFQTFTSTPFGDAAALDPATLAVLHLGANQEMKACADVQVLVERIAPDETRSALGIGSATGLTVPTATAEPLLPMGLDLVLTDTAVPAGHRLATTVTVTNRCRGNRAISLDYDGGSTPTRIATAAE